MQLVAPVQQLTAGGQVFAQPSDVLLERRDKWNAQGRRLASDCADERESDLVGRQTFPVPQAF